jgi:hypothetical protein
VIGEPAEVVVDAHLAVIDRRHPMLGIELVRLVDLTQALRRVRHEQVVVQTGREQVVVDPEEHVALGVPGGEDRAVHELPRISRLHDVDLDPRGPLERAQPALRHVERIVGHQRRVSSCTPPPRSP